MYSTIYDNDVIKIEIKFEVSRQAVAKWESGQVYPDINNIINDMAEVLNASQMQKLQEVLINRLSENNTVDYLQTGNEEFLYMLLFSTLNDAPFFTLNGGVFA